MSPDFHPTLATASTHLRSWPWMALALGVFVSGCASLAGDQLMDAPGGRIEISQIETAPPVIVFEAGLGAYKEEWNRVLPVIAATNTVFAYDRPGVGRSASTTRPRDGASIVEDLRTILFSRHLPPPYVLVGHSAGGLYLQLYARLHPEEVAGLVLVDSTHPTQFEGGGALKNRGILTNLVVSVGLTGSAKAEFAALGETGREVLAAPPAPADLPIVILTAPDKSGTAVGAFDNAKRADFHRLYPRAIVYQVDSGHRIPEENPVVVIDAIQEVLGAGRHPVRGRDRTP